MARDRDSDRRKRSRSRSRGRDRRRSRSRSRSRSRDRGDRHDRSRFLVHPDDHTSIAAQMQQQQMAALQQQQLHQQLLAQQLLTLPQAASGMPGVAGNETAAQLLDKKQREIYVGNLAIGSVSGDILAEFFNQALAHMVPNPATAPPVVNVNMDAQGRFAFIELRSRELADFALTFDKLVEICNRALHVGRPKGWTEPTGPPLPVALQGNGHGDGGGEPAAPTGPPPSRFLLLSNIAPCGEVREEEDRAGLQEDVVAEAGTHGAVEAAAVPPPPAESQDRGPARCYLRYATVEDAVKGKAVFDGRTLEGRRIRASFVEEYEFEAAARGEWPSRLHSVAGIPLPGLYAITPLVSGITGLTALNPALAALVQSNPGIAAMMKAGIQEEEVPYEEGYVKLRGFPPAVTTKAHIVELFSSCGDVSEEDVKLVYSADGTSLGEAFVHFKGPNAKVRLGLAKDRSAMQPGGAVAEVLTSMESDMHRRMLSGCKLV